MLLSHCMWDQAIKEAFEIICNKEVAGCTSAESLATFCDNILRKGGSEKLGDEALEETLEKVSCFDCFPWVDNIIWLMQNPNCLQVVTILTYISDRDLFVEFHRFVIFCEL